MKFKITKEWLARRLLLADDGIAAAGGTDFEELKQDTESRTVTPSVLAELPNEISKAVRYVREQHSWSRRDLADLADVDEDDIFRIETDPNWQPSPRTVVLLADVCGFSRTRFQQLANHTVPNRDSFVQVSHYRFAAHSKGHKEVSPEELQAVRALVEVLSDKK